MQDISTIFGKSGIAESDKVRIISDHREKRTKTSEWLRSLNTHIIEHQLEVADYIVSEKVGIERKTVSDFLQSLIDKRLFKQMEELTSNFEKPLLIIEGEQDSLFSTRRIHPNTIYGTLSAIALDFGVPIIWTSSPKATASQIFWTGKREQLGNNKIISTRVCKKMKSTEDNQEFIVAGLPNINCKLSKRMLEKFGSVKKVFSASEKRLVKVEGIGKKKAKEIWCLLNEDYKKN